MTPWRAKAAVGVLTALAAVSSPAASIAMTATVINQPATVGTMAQAVRVNPPLGPGSFAQVSVSGPGSGVDASMVRVTCTNFFSSPLFGSSAVFEVRGLTPDPDGVATGPGVNPLSGARLRAVTGQNIGENEGEISLFSANADENGVARVSMGTIGYLWEQWSGTLQFNLEEPRSDGFFDYVSTTRFETALPVFCR